MNGISVPEAPRGPLGMGRRLAALIPLAAIAAFLFAAPPAEAVAPDAGSIIGNQASATYDDGTGIKTATSNTVQTTVAQVASFTLFSTPQSSTAAPGQTVNFPHTLTNTGNGTDTFDLSATNTFAGTFNFTSVTLYADANCDGVPDNSTAITSSGALARNGQFCFIAAAIVPGSATSGTSDQMTVTGNGNGPAATGGGYTAASAATNTDTVTVTNNANITTTKALSVTNGPSPNPNLTITLTYTNTGATAATNVTLTDLIGSGATAGMSYVTGTGLWSGSGSALGDAAGGDPAGINYDRNVTTPNTVTAVIGSVAPGQSGTLSFRVDINAGLPPGSATTRNTAYLCYNDGVAQVPAGCTGAPGNSQPTNTVAYTVLGSFAVDATDVSATPAASSSTDDDGTTNDIVRDASAAQGSTVVFDNVIVNDGNGTDTFNITLPANSFPPGTSFQIFNSTNSAPLTDSNADAIPDTGPLAAGMATHVFVHVVLPPSEIGGPFDVTKRATSVGGGVFDEVTDRLVIITASEVDLTNNSPLPAGLGAGPGPEETAVVTNTVSPAATTTFTLFVNNTSTSFDNYDLAASGAPDPLPAGWSVSFRQATGGVGSECSTTGAVITNTGPIAGGASRAVCARVSVPATAPAGTTEVFFRARSPNTLAQDITHDAVTVNTVNQLTLIPNNVNQVFPGGNVVYQHTLTNSGNVTQTAIAFLGLSNTDTLSASGWNHVLYRDDGDGVFEPGTDDSVITPGSTTIASLAAGAGVTIWDNVFAPLGATVGTTNITTITAQSAAANASATDSTTVISSDLTLIKEQVRVDCTSGALSGSFVTTPLSGVNAVPPGGCLKYRVTGTNSGTTTLTILSISDSTPGFTTLETTPAACPVAATTTDAGPVTTGGATADEGTGTVTAIKDSLAPLTNVVLTYCVQIDQ